MPCMFGVSKRLARAFQFIVFTITTTLLSLNSYHIFSDTKAALFLLLYTRTELIISMSGSGRKLELCKELP